jgi:acetoacetyl-CoA synthetase
LNVHRGEIQSPHLAMAIECWSEDGMRLNWVLIIFNEILFEGKQVESDSGELVCVKPFPSMPVSFWNDPTGEKYHRAYFDKFPGLVFLWNSFQNELLLY